MINNENYAEVSRVLGQSETDKQLAFLGKALCEALPQLKNDPNFTSAADNWNRRQNTWPSELNKQVMDRCPPIHNQASISALNNVHAVYVHQVNDQRRAYQANLHKMVDDQTTRVRNGQQKLTDTQHAHRKYYDDERAKSDMLLAQSMTGAATAAANTELIEVRSRLQRAKARNDDFERHIISQIEAAQRNEKTIRKRLSHIKLLTPSKGEKYWILTTPEGQVGWVPTEDKYVDCYTNKPPSNSDLAKLLKLCPFTQTLNMALTIRN